MGDLVRHRAPHPHLLLPQSADCSVELEINSSTTLEAEDDMSSNSCSPSPSSLTPDIDSESTKSDNSFQTASSNPQLHPLPVRITDCYNSVSSRKLPHAGKNGAVVNKKL